MDSHPTESWSRGFARSQLLAWAQAHASWSSDAWARGDLESWISAFTDDVHAHIRRGIGPESYRGVVDLVERAWGLREFFPEEVVAVVDVSPPAVALYHIVMRNEAENEVGIFIAHRIDGSGRIAEFVVYDDDAPRAEVEAGVTLLSDRHDQLADRGA